jgi:GT2 family glycosyltransferase
MSGFAKWREIAAERDPGLVRGDLLRVDWAGFGMMVVKRGVFEAIGYPWFHFMIKDEPYQMEYSEDAGWCKRVGDAGFDIHIDPSVIIGHQKMLTLDEQHVRVACWMKWKAGVRVVPRSGAGASIELEGVKA